jgi:hypothetical protein
MGKDVSDTVHHVPFPINPVLYLQLLEHNTARLLSPRITIVRFHQKVHTFNPITGLLVADNCGTSYLLVHSHRVELKVRVRERARVVVDKIWVLFKVSGASYHFILTQRTFASARASRRAIDSARPVST